MQLSPVRTVSPEKLLREQPAPAGEGEICLDFYTPLDFDPPDRDRPWLLTASQFGAILRDRIRKNLGLELLDSTAAWEKLELLPYYWQAYEFRAESKSSGGQRRIIGNVGPLFLRGPLATVWPWLLLATEVTCGSRFPGLGACTLAAGRTMFAEYLCKPESYVAAHEELLARHDPPDEFQNALSDPRMTAVGLAKSVADKLWEPTTARGFRVHKENGGERLIVQLAAPDYVLHKALHQMLAPLFDRMFEPASVGYRPGYSPAVMRVDEAVDVLAPQISWLSNVSTAKSFPDTQAPTEQISENKAPFFPQCAKKSRHPTGTRCQSCRLRK